MDPDAQTDTTGTENSQTDQSGTGTETTNDDALGADTTLDGDGKGGEDSTADKSAADKGGEGDKAGEGEGDKAGADDVAILVGETPEAYELIAPEGYTLDPAVMALFQDTFKKLTLTNAGAQELVNAAPKFVDLIAKNLDARYFDAIVNQRKEWQAATAKDAEFGGEKLKAAQQQIASLFDAAGVAKDAPFRTLMRESGLGDHPDMIRTILYLAKKVGEDGFDRGEGNAGSEIPPWDRAYGGPVEPS